MNLPGLNFQLGEDIDALRDAVREFAQTEIAPRAGEKLIATMTATVMTVRGREALKH